MIYSGTLKLLPDITTQKTEFECCLFTDIFVFFQKIPIQPSEQRGIEESYRYVLKEHQRDANSGRHTRPRTAVPGTRYTAAQNFILTPIIRLEHLLIKKKACGGNYFEYTQTSSVTDRMRQNEKKYDYAPFAIRADFRSQLDYMKQVISI